MISLRAQNPAKPDEHAEPAPKAPVVETSSQPESSQKSSKSGTCKTTHWDWKIAAVFFKDI